MNHVLVLDKNGKHWTFQELADYYNVAYDTARRLFLKEPGVLKLRGTYRVPEEVRLRVERRSRKDQDYY